MFICTLQVCRDTIRVAFLCMSCLSLYNDCGFHLFRALDCNLLSNIQKLFYERIVAFGDVDYNKLSIVTGIIKIFLKVLVFFFTVVRLC